jgi:hypothetical protein
MTLGYSLSGGIDLDDNGYPGKLFFLKKIMNFFESSEEMIFSSRFSNQSINQALISCLETVGQLKIFSFIILGDIYEVFFVDEIRLKDWR